MKRVLVPLAQGAEEIEAITILDVLVRAGAKVFPASLDPNPLITCSRGALLQAPYQLQHLLGETFDLIALHGGAQGAENLSQSAELKAMVLAQAQANRPFAALCASPAVVFSAWGLTQGRVATCYPSFAHRLQAGEASSRPVVTDGPLTTGQGPASAMAFALELVRVLFGVAKRNEVAQGLLYPL